MADPEEIRIMTRLAILEKHAGGELKLVRENFRSDWFILPMIKNGVRVTLLFLVLAALWCAGQLNFILDLFAGDYACRFLIVLGIMYLVVLLLTLLFTVIATGMRTRRAAAVSEEYEKLLEELKEKREGKRADERETAGPVPGR